MTLWELIERAGAAVAVPLVLVAAGWPLARFIFRSASVLTAVPFFGLAYWAVVPYLLPFRGGLWVGLGVAGLAFVWCLRKHVDHLKRQCQRVVVTPAFWLFVLLWCSLQTVWWVNHVPIGMDSTMHTTSARLLAQNAGLPPNHAPFATELTTCPVNFGIPSVVAIPVMFGFAPEVAMLGCVPWAYLFFVLGVYRLIRHRVNPVAAMLLATFGLFSSRGLQETLYWGGFPTVAGVGLGLCAFAMLQDALREPHWRSSVGVGLLVAGIPLVHGIAGGLWLYISAAALAVIGLFHLRLSKNALAVVVVAVPVVLVLLGCYVQFGQVKLDANAKQWIYDYQQNLAPAGSGWSLLPNAIQRLDSFTGSEPLALWCVAVLGLLILRQWQALLIQVACAGMIVFVIINSRFWWLPISETLYPERAAYFMNALVIIACVECYRAVPPWSKAYRSGWALAPIILLCCSISYFKDRYHRIAWQVIHSDPSVSYPLIYAEEYEALCWCRDHLNSSTDIVAGEYNSAASYLPPVAGIACTGWHIHCLLIPQSDEFFRKHSSTYRWLSVTELSPAPANAIFHNARVAIVPIP